MDEATVRVAKSGGMAGWPQAGQKRLASGMEVPQDSQGGIGSDYFRTGIGIHTLIGTGFFGTNWKYS